MNPLLALAPPEVWREVFAWSARGPPLGRERGSRAFEEILYLAWTRFRAEVGSDTELRELGAALARYGAAALALEVRVSENAQVAASARGDRGFRRFDAAAVLEPAAGGWTRRVATLRIVGDVRLDRHWTPVPVFTFGHAVARVTDPTVFLKKFAASGCVAVDPTFVASVAAGRWEAWPWNLCGYNGSLNLAPRAETFALRSADSAAMHFDNRRVGDARRPHALRLANCLPVTRQRLRKLRKRFYDLDMWDEWRAAPTDPRDVQFPDPSPLRFSRVDVGCLVQGEHLEQLYAAADALDCTAGFRCPSADTGRCAGAAALLAGARAAAAAGKTPGEIRFLPGSAVQVSDGWRDLADEFPGVVAEFAAIGEMTTHPVWSNYCRELWGLTDLVRGARTVILDHYTLSYLFMTDHGAAGPDARVRDLTLVSTRSYPCLGNLLAGARAGIFRHVRRLRLVFAHIIACPAVSVSACECGRSRKRETPPCFSQRLEKIECAVGVPDLHEGCRENLGACLHVLEYFRGADAQFVFLGGESDPARYIADVRAAGWDGAVRVSPRGGPGTPVKTTGDCRAINSATPSALGDKNWIWRYYTRAVRACVPRVRPAQLK